jgi:hypothetical protein
MCVHALLNFSILARIGHVLGNLALASVVGKLSYC